MPARRVVCPGCKTTLQLPATMTQGKVKCPKCEKVLVIRAPATAAGLGQPATRPSQPARPAGQPAPRPARAAVPQPNSASDDLFGSLPDFGSAPTSGSQNFGLPPAQPPPGFAPLYQSPARAPVAKTKKPSGGGNAAIKIIGIVGGLGVMCVLLCAGGLFTLSYIGSRNSGWVSESFQGYTIDMPAGKDRKNSSQNVSNTTVHELIGRRKETGSQYSLVVAKMPAGANVTLEEFVRASFQMTNKQPVTRSGINGISGNMISGFGVGAGAQSETFLHNGNLVMASYSSYSKIQHTIGGKREPRKNELELDRPEEFFSSLKIAESG